LLKKIKKYLDFNSRFDDLKSRSNEILAYNHLIQFLPEKYFTKTSYSINYVPILHILNDMIIYKPRNILEFGGGLSTVVLANAIKELKLNTNIYTVDNDLNWLEYIKIHMPDNESSILCHCPIIDYDNKSFKKWYDLSVRPELRSMHEMDMFIIDGPWSKICSNARYGAVEFITALNIDKSKLIIYVDDIDRPDESLLFNDLKSKLNVKGFKYYKYGRISNCTSIETRPFKL
jgi:hypothetical protein